MINYFLNIISVISTLVVFNAIVYIILNLFIGKLYTLNKIFYKTYRVKDATFLFVGTLLLLLFFDIHVPY